MILYRNWRALSLAAASALALLLAAGHSAANPTGPTVVSGTATTLQNGNLLQITNSPNAIINWQSFSISLGNTTQFIQQSGASAVLNRVITGNASTILGALQSNGQVFLINPNGVVFGNASQVSTASFTASTGQLSDASFLAGATSPSGGTTISVSGPFTVGGAVTLSNGDASIGSISAPGADLSISVTGSLTVNGTISVLNGNFNFGTSGQPTIGETVLITVPVLAVTGTAPLSSNITFRNNTSSNSRLTAITSGAAVAANGSVTNDFHNTGGNLNLTAAGITAGTATAGVGISANALGIPASRGTQISVGHSVSPTPIARVVLQKREPLY